MLRVLVKSLNYPVAIKYGQCMGTWVHSAHRGHVGHILCAGIYMAFITHLCSGSEFTRLQSKAYKTLPHLHPFEQVTEHGRSASQNQVMQNSVWNMVACAGSWQGSAANAWVVSSSCSFPLLLLLVLLLFCVSYDVYLKCVAGFFAIVQVEASPGPVLSSLCPVSCAHCCCALN